MTELECAKVVALLLAGYPNGQYTDATAKLYESQLQDLEAPTASAAVERLLRTSKWLPTISEIRAAAVDVARGPRRLAMEAWGDVGMAIRLYGARQIPKFEDPAVAECVRLMGWRNLCLGDSSEASDRARFCELYEGLEERGRNDVAIGDMRLLAPAPRAPELPGEVLRKLAAIGGGAR